MSSERAIVLSLVPEFAGNIERFHQLEIKAHMERLPAWAEGLPLSVSVEHGPYYTK